MCKHNAILIQIPNKAHPTHPLLASLRTITLTTECVSSLPTVSKFIFAILFHIPPILLCIAECGTIPTVTGLTMPLWANLRRLTKLHLRDGNYFGSCWAMGKKFQETALLQNQPQAVGWLTASNTLSPSQVHFNPSRRLNPHTIWHSKRVSWNVR